MRAHPAATVRSADLTDPAAWAALPHGWDQIYLLAAVVGVRNVEADPARTVRVNALTALHAIDWIEPGERIFFASTSEVYAGGVDAGIVPVPTAEDVPVMVPDVTAPRFAYAISKLLGEAGFLHAAKAKGFAAVVGRFHNVYGPRMGADHVIPEMAMRAMAGENPFRVWGADQYRAFCYVEDAVDAMLRLMATPEASGQIVHIGDDTQETNITDLAKLVLRLTGADAALEPAPAPPGSVARRCPDLGAAARADRLRAGGRPGGGRAPHDLLVPGKAGAMTTPNLHDAAIGFYYGAGRLDALSRLSPGRAPVAVLHLRRAQQPARAGHRADGLPVALGGPGSARCRGSGSSATRTGAVRSSTSDTRRGWSTSSVRRRRKWRPGSPGSSSTRSTSS